MSGAYASVTHSVSVSVEAFFLPDQSRPDERRFVWAYRIRIQNHRRDTVQVLRRSWRITDARGQVLTVDGEGVVGQQPILEPGDAFDYTSGTPLETPSGIMSGSYLLSSVATGETFDVAIPTFSLDSPHAPRAVH